jgi:V/A-type H+-transporting ATPase subunit I
MLVIIGILLAFFGFGAAIYVVAACLVIVVLTGGRNNKGLGKITGGLGALYNGFTGNLSDVLSYSRLMALAMSTGVVAQVMNTLGNMGGTSLFGWIFFVLVFVVGQVFNFAISILGAFVHSCRLQFVELFGRCYEGGGRDFRPLQYRTKYVEISKEA